MTEQIVDGSGKSYKAKVDSQNRLWTYATIRQEIAYQSEYRERAFIAYGRRNFVAGSTNENVMYFKYEGVNSCHISKIEMSTNSTMAKVELYIRPDYVSGGTAIIPLNLNLRSGRTSDSLVYTGTTDIVATVDSDNEIMDVRLSINGTSTFTFDFSGGFILGRNDSFLLLGDVASAGDKIRTAVYFYEEII